MVLNAIGAHPLSFDVDTVFFNFIFFVTLLHKLPHYLLLQALSDFDSVENTEAFVSRTKREREKLDTAELGLVKTLRRMASTVQSHANVMRARAITGRHLNYYRGNGTSGSPEAVKSAIIASVAVPNTPAALQRIQDLANQAADKHEVSITGRGAARCRG